MQKVFRLFLFLLSVSIFPVLCQASTIILSNASPDHTVTSTRDENLYGTSTANTITLESGAKAELVNFPGQNNIQLQSSSDLFTVSRSGTVVTFQGSDGTILKIPATTDVQTISFNGEESRVLQIHNNQVVLDDQVITPTPSSIEGSQEEPINQPPAAATQISPSDTVSTNTPTYTWNAVSNASHYYLFPTDSISSILYTATDAGCSSGTGTCSITTGVELANDSYTWYVQSHNNSYGSLPLSGGMNYTVAFSPGRPGWSSGTPMPTGRYGSASAVVGNDIYIFGGGSAGGELNTVEKYNTLTNSWTSLSSMPFSDYQLRGIAVGGKIYIFGGSVNSGHVYRFDPATENWTRLNNMPAIYNHLGFPAVVNNKVYIFGGLEAGYPSKKALEYNPSTDTWIAKAYMPTARYNPATAVYEGKIYVMGGNFGNKKNELYDPATNTWQTKNELPFSTRWGFAGEINGKIFIVGYSANDMAIYSPVTDSYISTAGIIGTHREGFTGEVVNEKLYVFGGYDELYNFGGYDSAYLDLLDIYSPSDLHSESFQSKSATFQKIELDDSYMSDFYLYETPR